MSQPIQKTVIVACTITHAFETFVSKIDLWWPPSHRSDPNGIISLEPQLGGRFVETSPTGEETLRGEVQHYDPPNKLTYTWLPGAIDVPTLVEITFESLTDETTQVHVNHREGAADMGDQWPTRAQRFSRSWDEVLADFVHHFSPESIS